MEGTITGFDMFLNLVIEEGFEAVKREDQVQKFLRQDVVLKKIVVGWFLKMSSNQPRKRGKRLEQW